MNCRCCHIVFLCVLCVVGVLLAACSKPTTPKEYGYFRIAVPQHQFDTLTADLLPEDPPYAFSVSKYAQVIPVDEQGEKYWLDIHYPTINATVHCSYKPIVNNFPQLLADAQEFVYSHSVKATAIPEQEYADTVHGVYGVYYELEGNTATPMQFFLTDSARHFFRAAVYVNTIPNQDSLAPVIDFLKVDVRTMIESFRWQ